MQQQLFRDENDDTIHPTDLSIALLSNCLSYLPVGNYLFVAGTCCSFQDGYTSLHQRHNANGSTETNWSKVVTSVSRVEMVLYELNHENNQLTITWQGFHAHTWKAIVKCAASNGNLQVLKWTKENKESDWDDKIPGNFVTLSIAVTTDSKIKLRTTKIPCGCT